MRRLALVVIAAVCACSSCHGHNDAPPPPTRSCGLTVWYHPASDPSHVDIIGSWDGWSRPGTTLSADRSDGWRVRAFDLAPGEYSYAILDDGAWVTDPNVGTTAVYQGHEVTWVSLPSCEVPLLRTERATASPAGEARIEASFLASRTGEPVDPLSFSVTDRQGKTVSPFSVEIVPATGKIAFSLQGLQRGKFVFTLRANDTRGRSADDTRATVWVEPTAFDLRDSVIYQVMVDRYRSATGALAAPSTPAGRAGGTVEGVRRALESGELAALGINTLWLSPLYANPVGAFPGGDGRLYTGYHGYWPTASRALEPSQADEASLDALVEAAHARGVRIVFDVVPHHVHEQHPYFAQHKSDGWFSHPDGSCVCGNDACAWSAHIGECWFTSYLPSFDWAEPAVATQATADVLWWLDRFDGDGVRIDAVPMMPRAAIRRIAAAARDRFDNPDHTTLLLGENFVGSEGYASLRYNLGPFGLNSEFHFPLMWALRSAVAQGVAPMSDVDAAIETGLTDWSGSGATMSLIMGNHDVSRFASVSAGDDGGDGWSPAPQPTSPLVYAKQTLALGILFALPGAPLIYYGDEVALAGRGDPDSRRVMPAGSALSSLQKTTRAAVHSFAAARACIPALRRGSYRRLYVDDETLAFAREAPGEATAIVVVSRQPHGPISVPVHGIEAGVYVDALSAKKVTLSSALTNFEGEPFSVAIYIPTGGACASPALSPP